MLHRFTIASNEGPRILWEQLKGKKVKTNDGHGVGEIRDSTRLYTPRKGNSKTKTSHGSQSI